MTSAWIVWDDSDYYGPDFHSLHITEEGAKTEADKLNDDKLNDERWSGTSPSPRTADWPFSIEEHEMLP